VARPVSNDDAQLVPQTTFDGPALTFDFPGLAIGVAEYAEGPTGCTVFLLPAGAATAIDERGGMVGKTGDYEWNHAICLAGGSLPGLEAAAGVGAELFARHDYRLDHFALVSGAIIFDYGARANRIYPDKALGRAAVQAARPGVFPLGRRGAGRSAGCGGVFDRARAEPAGQGGAFREIGPTKVGVFTVVNALGAIIDRQGQVVRGNRDPATGERRHPADELHERLARGTPTASPAGNTTLTVLVTNQKLSRHALQQLARQVHSSMARAISPFHTGRDGDVLYALTTNAVENRALDDPALGMLASELAWDAVLRCFDAPG
jgi:L-aminopeptidase/D-esterase-like protein